MKKLLVFLLILFSSIFTPKTFAQNSSFVSVVNPVRGEDFWDLKDQKAEDAVLGQINILDQFRAPATWLVRFDALENKEITDILKRRSDEKGLFLEITPTWTDQANVTYRKSDIWHNAGSAFLTGYELEERKKLIDAAFNKFKNTFGHFPVSVGAWWIDSFSLGYMQEKYGVSAALIVADQYSTDNYQIWGQYFGTPYYPVKNNALHPAQTLENKLDVVMMQWATRDPVNSYGNGVSESTFSVQANDYIDYHSLDINYFSKLIDIYTKSEFNQFSQVVVGLENSYEWNKYSNEYKNQIEVLSQKQKSGQLSLVTMKNFASWYRGAFPKVSPPQLVVTDDPLGSFKKTVWFMNPYYRVGWFLNSDGSVFRDIRQYIEGEEELCLKARCDSVNFATGATRVLDEVSFGHKWVIDQGKVSNFKIAKEGENFVISYKNEAGNLRKIELLPRDISIDGKVSSIDAAILDATKNDKAVNKNSIFPKGSLKWSPVSVVLKLAGFLLFLLLALIIPGIILTGKLTEKEPTFQRLFISVISGIGALVLLFYLLSLANLRSLIFVYVLINFFVFLKFRLYRDLFKFPKIKDFNLILLLVILAGTIFGVIPTFRSGLSFEYGVGFWGPNTHDGVWHIGLINQLIKNAPPQNPVFAGETLKNYHFFYDLLVAATTYISGIPVADLLFRFYPIIFSLMLGVGSYYLIMKLFRSKAAAAFSLYLIYFAGSFGWIVEYLREKHIGGESAFWVNQAVSFNLNPPYAVSLLILIALIHLLFFSEKMRGWKIATVILTGILASFKSYTGVLVLSSLFIVAAVEFIRNRSFSYFWIWLISSVITALLFLSNFKASSALIVFSPFWFIHSMVDSPDRVGWYRLSLARTTAQSLGQWLKFIAAETISLMLFIFGNLGLRFFAFGSLIKIKEVFKNNALMFIFVLTLLSITIPILFIQSGNPWNTIQFFYPALYTTALLSGPVIAFLVFRLNKVLSFSVVALVVILAPINSLVTANGYLGKTPHAFVPVKEEAGLNFLAKQEDGIVLTYPYDEKLKTKVAEPWSILIYDSTAYVSAFSKKGVYLEDLGQNQILLTDYKKRLVASNDFFQKPTNYGLEFLNNNKIRYVYLPKIFNIRLDEKEVDNIFENEEVVIYRVKK